LIGDDSDNVPGAKSVGPKTALKILQYGDLSDLVSNPDLINDNKLRQLVVSNKDNIILSQSLISLKADLPVEASLEELTIDFGKQAPILYKLFGEYDINSLQRRLEKFIKNSDKDLENNIGNRILDAQNSYESIDARTKELIYEQGVISICISGEKYKIFFNRKLYAINEILDLKEILESSSIRKITYDALNLEKKLISDGITINSLYDLSILYYNLIGVKANDSLLDILYFLGLDEVGSHDIHQSNKYIAFYEEIFNKGIKYLFENKHIGFFEEDRKIYEILRKMEFIGVLVDKKKLSDLREYFENILEQIKDKVIDLTGYDFNMLSPKQTSDVLFNKLELQPAKKSKNEGVYSTKQGILEDLSASGVEVADYILQYRSIYKLKSSYCDGLAEQININTGRIHTTFALNGATTGRILSSVDYSQIELRILSALANVSNLKLAFENGEDIHALTASQVFGIPLKDVDSFWRSKAKAVNFGIIYGISAFGLSKQLKISTSEADKIIKNYLQCYGEINEYLEKTKSFANRFGYVKTMFGRHCYLRTSSNVDKGMNFHERSFFERAAINAPIQGTASDVIKKSMIEVDYFIKDGGLRADSLLQIHDELIFEVHNDDVEFFSSNIVEIMESVGNSVDLKLKVDCVVSDSWYENYIVGV